MSGDESGRPVQRYSRFSRSNYDDLAPPRPPEDTTLADITARALRRAEGSTRRPSLRDNGDDRQPPPPEPSPYWSEAASQPSRTPPPALRHESREPALRRESPQPALRREAPAEAPPQAPAPKAETITAEVPEAPRKKAGRVRGERAGRATATLSAAVKAARTKAGPRLLNGAFWVARNLRRREIRKRYGKALIFGHTRVADRKLEKLFFVPTLQTQQIDPAPERGILYDGPIPASVFNWVMAQVPDDLRNFAFIDVRAGRGRTSLLAARRNFSRIIAYEYDAQLFDDLSMNIAQYPRSLMLCRNIDHHRGDVDGIRLPDQPCVLYFSGAWREPMIPGVMDYVRQTYQQSPRRIYVIMENVDDETPLAGNDIFQRLDPGLGARLKMRFLSPMAFRVYRTIA